MERFRMTDAPSILLGSSQILAQEVSLIVSFHLHYFSSPSDHVLPKELSQHFVPIPGAGHAISRVEALLLTLVLM
jgi:hypothetical protein